MDRKWKSGASGTPPDSADNASVGYATDGDPGAAIAATKPGPWWFHMITEEVRKVIADAGLTPDVASTSQLSAAISLLAASAAGASVQTTTSTGTVNDFAATAARRLLLRCNNASALTLTGFVAGTSGDEIDLVSVGAGAVTLSEQTGSSAANQIICPAAVNLVLVAGGRARLRYDGVTARWRVVAAHAGSARVVVEGIQFPATQAPSSSVNCLDDYERGTWTPVIGGSGGTSGQTYSQQSGSYVKIGRLVIASYAAVLSAKGTITGNVQIQGLPFTIGASGVSPIGMWGSTATAFVWMGALAGSTAITIYAATAAATNPGVIATADVGNATAFYSTVIYIADQ